MIPAQTDAHLGAGEYVVTKDQVAVKYGDAAAELRVRQAEITPEMEHLARRAILNEIEDVTDAMIQAYEEVIRIDPEWEL